MRSEYMGELWCNLKTLEIETGPNLAIGPSLGYPKVCDAHDAIRNFNVRKVGVKLQSCETDRDRRATLINIFCCT